VTIGLRGNVAKRLEPLPDVFDVEYSLMLAVLVGEHFVLALRPCLPRFGVPNACMA